MRISLCIALVLTAAISFGQVPVITHVEAIRTYPSTKVVISGSGFSATSSNLDVWFDNVKGTILTSSDFAIEVTIPASARAGNVEVINKVSHLSARSRLKFAPYFSGEGFDPAKLGGSLSFTGTSNEVFDVCTCDFDVDGRPDLAATKVGVAADILILRNTSAIGNIAFAQTSLNLGSQTFNSACGDLNGDGKPDLIASRGGVTRNEVFVRLNTSTPGAISFSASPSLLLDVSHVAFRLAIRDLNADGKPEIIVSNAFQQTGNILYIFVNQSTGGTLSINQTPVKITVPEASSSYGLDVQDLDGDNLPDIIFNQFNNSDLFILRNTFSGGDISFAAAQKIALAGSLNHLTTADFNNDGKLDIAVTNSTVNNKVHILLNQGSSSISFGAPLTFDTGDGPWGIDAADLDGDQDTDLLVANIDFNTSAANTELTVLLNNGSFPNPSFIATTFNVGKKTRNLETGDFDGDAKPDIAFTTVNGNSVDILRNQNCYVPQVLNTAPVTICNGQTITLTGLPNPAAAYQWLESGNSVPSNTNATLNITTAGSYTLTATTEGGACVKTTSPLVVAVNAGSVTQDPTILNTTAGVISVCLGSNLQLSTSDVEPGYSWTGPNGFISSQQNSTLNSVTSAHGGVYSLQLSNGPCKSNVATVRVDVVSSQSFSVSSNVTSNIICQGGSVNLSVSTQAGYTYQWIKNGVDISGQAGTTLVVTQEGSYKVRVTSPAPLLCSSETQPVSVTVLTTPTAAFNALSTACVGQVASFTNQSQMDSRGTATFSWTFGDTGTSNIASPSHTYSNSISASVGLTVGYFGVSGCSSNASKTVVVNAPINPTIDATATSLCEGDPVTLSIPATYTSTVWSDNATTSSTSVTSAGTYTVSANDINGCSTTAQIVITSKPVPTIAIASSPDPPSVAPGVSVSLVASGADTYSWLPPDNLSNASVADPTATPQTTTTYVVTGALAGGCTATASITIEVSGDLKVTNAFSPNGDGLNDLWVIPGIETLSNCKLTLFDASGSMIFERSGYQNDWDGTFNGKKVPRGTYYFIIGGCPDNRVVTGHVLIAY